MRKNKVMHIVLFIFCIINCYSCSQKKIIFKIEELKEQELRIYYNKQGYPPLPQDSVGNFLVTFDTTKTIYTSTNFIEIKEHMNVFCFKGYNNKCFSEDHEIADLGFTIHTYSHFSSDTTNSEKYLNPYDQILIERIKTESKK